MRLATLTASALAILSAAGPALAQTTIAPQRFDRAPWWMDQPIIASTGLVETHIRANRAAFSASFQVVAKTSPEATKAAADKVRALGQALAAYGVEKVQIETTFNMRPIYDQYRDKEGNLISNERADKIDSYEVNANVSVSVRDVALIERVYATVLAARPTSTQPVYFRLEPDNATKTELYGLAVADAARRAKLSVEATGARLGAVKLIDPTGRACETDVLVAGAPRGSDNIVAYDVGSFPNRNLNEAMSRVAGAPPPPPPPPPPAAPGQLRPEDMQLPLQAPLRTLNAKVCVVYSLGG